MSCHSNWYWGKNPTDTKPFLKLILKGLSQTSSSDNLYRVSNLIKDNTSELSYQLGNLSSFFIEVTRILNLPISADAKITCIMSLKDDKQKVFISKKEATLIYTILSNELKGGSYRVTSTQNVNRGEDDVFDDDDDDDDDDEDDKVKIKYDASEFRKMCEPADLRYICRQTKNNPISETEYTKYITDKYAKKGLQRCSQMYLSYLKNGENNCRETMADFKNRLKSKASQRLDSMGKSIKTSIDNNYTMDKDSLEKGITESSEKLGKFIEKQNQEFRHILSQPRNLKDFENCKLTGCSLPQLALAISPFNEFNTPLNIIDIVLIGFSVFPYIGWIFGIFMIFRALLEKRWIYSILMTISWYQWFYIKMFSFGLLDINYGPWYKLFYVAPYATRSFNFQVLYDKFSGMFNHRQYRLTD